MIEYEDCSKNQLTNSKGEVRERNNIQFLDININKSNPIMNIITAFEAIPTQIEEYFQILGNKIIEQ